MIELVCILLILGIVSLVVVNRMTGSSISLAPLAEQVKSHLRYAQSRAMNTNQRCGIRFENGQYYFFIVNNGPQPLRLPGEDSLRVRFPQGITMLPADAIVSFDGWGRPYSDAAVSKPQKENRQLTLSDGAHHQAITITANTGFIP